MYEIVIVADTNDADYITSINDVTIEQIVGIQPVINAIKEYNRTTLGHNYNWPDSEHVGDSVEALYPHLKQEDIDFFKNLAPCGEDGIHTIVSVFYYPKSYKITLL